MLSVEMKGITNLLSNGSGSGSGSPSGSGSGSPSGSGSGSGNTSVNDVSKYPRLLLSKVVPIIWLIKLTISIIVYIFWIALNSNEDSSLNVIFIIIEPLINSTSTIL